MASVPDVCKVLAPPAPPIPTPFPNIAQCPMAMPLTCTLRVKFVNMPVLHVGSEIPMTSGDEAGVGGGMISGTFAQKAVYRMGNPKVMVEGQPVAMMQSPTAHNGANANAPVGMQTVPSQPVVLV